MPDDDFFLALLIQWAQKGAGLPITLSVGGTIIAGDMISEHEYFDGLAQLYQATDPEFDEDATLFKDLLRSIPHAADQAAMMHLDEGADPEAIRKIRENWAEACVHLNNTQVLLSDGSVQDWIGGLWRGKRSAVDGYWLGRRSS